MLSAYFSCRQLISMYNFHKNSIAILCLFLFSVSSGFSQIESIADKVLSVDLSTALSEEDKAEVEEFWKLIRFLRKEERKENGMEGNGRFGFYGNQTDFSDIFTVNGGTSFTKEYYPVDLDFSVYFETIFRSNQFQENVSNIDISFDYSSPNIGDGLVLESFVFLNRSNNAYLGIDQRYEVGGGFIFNKWIDSYSEPGIAAFEELDRQPIYKTDEEGNLIKCYQDACALINNPKQLSKGEIKTIEKSRSRYKKVIKKRHSKLRLSLIVGAYYELDKSTMSDSILIDGVETLVTESFNATHEMKMEFRPGILFRPTHMFKIKLSPFIKTAMPWNFSDTVISPEGREDLRDDYIINLVASMNANFSQNMAISLRYSFNYENSPQRRFLPIPGYPLLLGQQAHHSFNMSFNFGF